MVTSHSKFSVYLTYYTQAFYTQLQKNPHPEIHTEEDAKTSLFIVNRQRACGTSAQMKLDPKKTALLTLDLQKGIFGFGSWLREPSFQTRPRRSSMREKPVFSSFMSAWGFHPGTLRSSRENSMFSMVKKNNLFVQRQPSPPSFILQSLVPKTRPFTSNA